MPSPNDQEQLKPKQFKPSTNDPRDIPPPLDLEKPALADRNTGSKRAASTEQAERDLVNGMAYSQGRSASSFFPSIGNTATTTNQDQAESIPQIPTSRSV